ncbi:MAG: hypothetical protein D3923_10255 [Candidatus Electrothrix sp. AR3]|nr:hypothetical protein [Candidatus Electrothrix sp. AR3]
MKNIPITTALLWVVSLFGYCILPEVFKDDLLQFPLVIILSILLPFSFWQVATRENKKYLSLLFVGIFIVNVSILLFVMQNNFSTQQAITKELNKGIRPEFAAYLETAADGKRKLAAQLIYQHHDIALPYKNDANTYTLYVPSESDKKQYQKNFIAINILKMKNQQMRSSLFTAGLLLIIHGSLFLAFLVFLVLYEKKTS